MQSIWDLPGRSSLNSRAGKGQCFTGLDSCSSALYGLPNLSTTDDASLAPSVLRAETSQLGLQLDLHVDTLEVEQNQ